MQTRFRRTLFQEPEVEEEEPQTRALPTLDPSMFEVDFDKMKVS